MDTVLTWILPEFFMSSFGLSRRRAALLLGAIVAFCAVVAVACVVLLGKEQKTARHSAERFAAALVSDKPAAAPPGARDYVAGVRRYYRGVTSARIIGDHNKGVNTGNNADTRAFWVVEMLLQTERGPAAIELEYDNHAWLSERVSRIYELKPDKAPGLSGTERNRLDRAFQARGGQPADAGKLSGSVVPARRPMQLGPPDVATPKTVHIHMPARLRCVQRAHGDVAKLQKCAS
jgi:hypothetical protein